MDVYKEMFHSDSSLEKLKLIIVVRGEFNNNKMIGYTWNPTASKRTLKYFLAYYDKNKAILHQLDFIG